MGYCYVIHFPYWQYIVLLDIFHVDITLSFLVLPSLGETRNVVKNIISIFR